MNRIAPPTRRPWGLIAVGPAAGLPALGLAVLATRALVHHQAERRAALEALPARAAATLAARLSESADALRAGVDATPVVQWAEQVLDGEARSVPSPLVAAFGDLPVLARFGVDELDRRERGLDAIPIHFLLPPDPSAAVRRAIEAELDRWGSSIDGRPLAARLVRLAGRVRVDEVALDALLHFVIEGERRPEDYEETVRATERLLQEARRDRVELAVGAPVLRSVQGDDALLTVVRQVLPTAATFDLLGGQSSSETLELVEQELPRRTTLLQGLVLDRAALFALWLERARGDLPPELSLAVGGGAPAPDAPRATLDLARAVGLDGSTGRAAELVRLSVDPGPLLRRQRLELWGLLAGLLTTLGALGWWLVATLRRILRQIRRAERIGNFVAAVTHEFRTPLSTIALHAEMLLDGWAEDPDQRHEYHRRIAAETSRLSRLVERILEQSQLTRGRVQAPPVEPRLDDLSRTVEQLRPSIEAGASAGPLDVAFDLADDLPPVRLTHDAIESIVTNLVENARKYAPVPLGGEPILVRTTLGREGVRLEVLDRGPGIPEGERRRVFEAFYRLGNETTRTTTGTGLGLHLVDLQTRSLGGRVEALDREGGGCCMRVVLPLVGR